MTQQRFFMLQLKPSATKKKNKTTGEEGEKKGQGQGEVREGESGGKERRREETDS